MSHLTAIIVTMRKNMSGEWYRVDTDNGMYQYLPSCKEETFKLQMGDSYTIIEKGDGCIRVLFTISNDINMSTMMDKIVETAKINKIKFICPLEKELMEMIGVGQNKDIYDVLNNYEEKCETIEGEKITVLETTWEN